MVAERSMEKAAREEGHCSKGEKPCQERGRGLAETKGRRRGEASSSNRRREKAAEKEPIGCCAPAYLEAARYFLPKLFQLPAVPPPSSSTENLLLSLHLLSSQHALLRRDLVTQDRNWQGRLLRRCVTVMSSSVLACRCTKYGAVDALLWKIKTIIEGAGDITFDRDRFIEPGNASLQSVLLTQWSEGCRCVRSRGHYWVVSLSNRRKKSLDHACSFSQ